MSAALRGRVASGPRVGAGRGLSPRLLVAAVVGGAATTAGIALTATSGWLIVRASERPVILTLLTAIVAVRAFGMARALLRHLERLRSHDVALAELADLRTEAYARLVPLTPARLGRRRRADLLGGVVDDLTDVVEAQVRVTVPVAAAVIAGGLTALLAALLAPVVGLVLAGTLFAATGVCAVAWHLERRSQQELLAARGEVTRVSELVGGRGSELQAIGAGGVALGWLDEAHRVLLAASRRQSRGRALASAALILLIGAAAVGIAVLSSGLDVSAPVKGLLVLTPVALGDALLPLVDVVRALARAQAAAARLESLLDQQPAVKGSGTLLPREPSAPRISLRGVTGSWSAAGPDTGPDVGPVDLDLAPGSRTLLTGRNGGGKSTLLAVLGRHLEPSGGQYLIDGTDVRSLRLDAVRALVAVVDDEPHVLGTTLRENLRLALPRTGQLRDVPAESAGHHVVKDNEQDLEQDLGGCHDGALVEGLCRAGLGGWLAALPHGLDTRLGAGGRGLSGGERARLSLARAIVSQRPVILLDEPVAHLDHATATQVLDDLLAGTSGRTVVMVSHQPIAPERFDRVLEVGGVPAPIGW
ncbi:thiol reductant ABC exporter subunit CydC [Lapillicoccus sp.]|uniref:thiol reductant ABC exporter subunit CydC n=1 Tax=Lapillicoccus sp. TaxID=1909287 RepID=UPI0039839CBD